LIESKLFIPADAILLTGDRSVAVQANHNLAAGPGWTILKDGKPIAAGGIRVHGVGTAWFMMSEEAKKKHLKSVIRIVKAKFDEMHRGQELCEVYAEVGASRNLLEHLGFEKRGDIYLR